jgi:iron transport multicopper oxidase
MLNCTANIAITKIVDLSIASSVFQAQNSSLPTGSLKAGATFSFPVTFNLTAYVVNSGSSSAPSVKPGVQSTALTVYTQNGVTGYSTQQSVSLTGTAASQSPWLSISPLQVNFPEVVIGSAAGAGGSFSTFFVQNIGKADLTIISGYAFSKNQSGPYTNVTFRGTTTLDANGYFTTQNLPAVGTVIQPDGSITISASFNTTKVGNFYSILAIYSNGGSAYVILSGTANTLPMALLEQSTNEGGWVTIPDCAVPSDGCTAQVDIGTLQGTGSLLQTIRLTNNGGSDLTITKSKPPTYLARRIRQQTFQKDWKSNPATSRLLPCSSSPARHS